MSRPHHGQRASLPFGNAFRRILPKRSHYISPKLLALLNSFEQTMADNLKKLKPNNMADIVSLSWLRQAMEFLSETHSSIKTLVTDLHFPVTDWDEKWVDIYLDSSVKMLDICIALSSELSRLDQGQLLLQYVLHILDSSKFPSSGHLERSHESLHDWTKQINSRSSRLETCALILPGLVSSLYVAKVKNSAKGKVLMRVLYGVKVVTVFVCSIVIAELLGTAKPLTELHVANKFLWAEEFNNLQAEVNREIRSMFSSGKLMVQELKAVETCVERLHGPSCDVSLMEDDNVQKSNGIVCEDVKPLEKVHNHEVCEKSNNSELDGKNNAIISGDDSLKEDQNIQQSNDIICEDVKRLVEIHNHEVCEKSNNDGKNNAIISGDVNLKEDQNVQQNNYIMCEDVKPLVEIHNHEVCEKSNNSDLDGKNNASEDVMPMDVNANIEECDKMKVYVSELAARAQELANGLDMFSKQVEDFFQIVLTGRDALLCNLREPDVVQEFSGR